MSSSTQNGGISILLEQCHSMLNQVKLMHTAALEKQEAEINELQKCLFTLRGKRHHCGLRQQAGEKPVQAPQIPMIQVPEVGDFEFSLDEGSAAQNEAKNDADGAGATDDGRPLEYVAVESAASMEDTRSDPFGQISTENKISIENYASWITARNEWCQLGPEEVFQGSDVVQMLLQIDTDPYSRKRKAFRMTRVSSGTGLLSYSASSLNLHMERRPWIMHPSGAWRMKWMTICLLLISYDVIFVPLQAFEIQEHPVVVVLEWMVAVFWTVDMIMTFCTGYFQGAAAEMRPMKIAMHYMKTWLFLDVLLIGTAWFENITIITTNQVYIVRATPTIRILRSLRLLRLAKLVFFWHLIKEQITSAFASLCFAIIMWIVLLLMAVHAISCVWYTIGKRTHGGWATSDIDASLNVIDNDMVYWYFLSSRWTLGQINGRTDLDTDRNKFEVLFTCVVALIFAVVFMAIFVSSLTTTMMALSVLREEHNRLQRVANDYLKGSNVSREVIANVKRHLGVNKVKVDSLEDERTVLQALPQQLQHDLLYEVRGPIIMHSCVFNNINERCPRALRQVCYQVLMPQVATAEETLFDVKDPCDRMLLLAKGRLVYNLNASESAGHVDNGIDVRRVSVVSEAALWTNNWVNQGKLRAICDSFLLSAGVPELANVLYSYKPAYCEVTAYVHMFVDELRKCATPNDIMVVTFLGEKRENKRNSMEAIVKLLPGNFGAS